MENYPIYSLGFSISLRMGDGGKLMLDVELGQEFLEPSIIELSVVVHNDRSREAITIYNRLPDESFSLGRSDVGHKLSFDPFGEIIYDNEEEFLL